MKKYVKLFEAYTREGGNTGSDEIYVVMEESPYQEVLIAIANADQAYMIQDKFEDMFLKNLSFDASEIAFDFIRVRRVSIEDLEEMLEDEDFLGYESMDAVLDEIKKNGSIMVKDYDYAIELADEVSNEYRS